MVYVPGQAEEICRKIHEARAAEKAQAGLGGSEVGLEPGINGFSGIKEPLIEMQIRQKNAGQADRPSVFVPSHEEKGNKTNKSDAC